MVVRPFVSEADQCHTESVNTAFLQHIYQYNCNTSQNTPTLWNASVRWWKPKTRRLLNVKFVHSKTPTRWTKIGWDVLCQIIHSIHHMISQWMVEYKLRECLLSRNSSRHFSYIYATFEFQCFHGFDKYGWSLLCIVAPRDIQHLVQYPTSKCESRMCETRSDILRVQVTSGGLPALRRKHRGLRHWKRTSTAVYNHPAGHSEPANDVHHPFYFLLLWTIRTLTIRYSETSTKDLFTLGRRGKLDNWFVCWGCVDLMSSFASWHTPCTQSIERQSLTPNVNHLLPLFYVPQALW